MVLEEELDMALDHRPFASANSRMLSTIKVKLIKYMRQRQGHLMISKTFADAASWTTREWVEGASSQLNLLFRGPIFASEPPFGIEAERLVEIAGIVVQTVDTGANVDALR
jgi:hypothetical protein